MVGYVLAIYIWSALTQAICTFREAESSITAMRRSNIAASGLNLVIAAIVYWNSTYMADAIAQLRSASPAIPDELIAHTSPVGRENVTSGKQGAVHRAILHGNIFGAR